MIMELIDTIIWCFQFFWYAFWTVVMAWMIVFIWGAWQTHKLYKKEGLVKLMHSRGDALKAGERAREFLYKRCMILTSEDTPDLKAEKGMFDEYLSDYQMNRQMAPAVINFFALCHKVGCEVVIRQISNEDIEVEHSREELEECLLSSIETMEKHVKKYNESVDCARSAKLNKWHLIERDVPRYTTPNVLQPHPA